MESSLKSIVSLLDSPSTIAMGLDQLDYLLAQICLKPPSRQQQQQQSQQPQPQSKHRPHAAQTLANNELYIEFIRLQDGFQYNVATKLITCLATVAFADDHERFGTSATNSHNYSSSSSADLTVYVLELLQGLFLLHYQSRNLLSAESTMALFLDLLTPELDGNVHIAVVNTLVSGMVREVRSIRRFELMGGLEVISRLFKMKETPKDVKLRILEFWFFYLVPETQKKPLPSHQPNDLNLRRTAEEKRNILGKYLGNVNGLVQELNVSKPFGDMKHEW